MKIPKCVGLACLFPLLLVLPAPAEAQFAYGITNGAVTITGYSGPGGAVIIPNAVNGLPVTNIGDYAFVECGLTSITIPNSVTSIGEGAFYACALTNVTIGNGVTTIGDYAFEMCGGLTGVTIGDSVTNIGDYASKGCPLTSVTIPNTVTTIGDDAFAQCYVLTNVTIGNSVTNIGDYAFYSCTRLASVTIGNSVTNISDDAFAVCSSLISACFQGNAPAAHSSVFLGDNYLTVYYLPGTKGWGPFFADRPTALWLPQVQTSYASFGLRTNQFGFSITWTSGMVILVEACTDLANPVWSPVGTNTLTSGETYFGDPHWKNYPSRFYRVRSP